MPLVSPRTTRKRTRSRRRLRPAELQALGLCRIPVGARQLTVGPNSRNLRVGLVGSRLHGSVPGGGEIQLAQTQSGLLRHGVAARCWDPVGGRLEDIDCLHLFGSHREWLPLIVRARQAGKRVAVSPIAWFDLASRWHAPGAGFRRLRGTVGQLARSLFPRLPDWRSRLYHGADILLPNSQAEAQQLTRYFGVAPQKIQVVPNGADPRLAFASPDTFAERVGGPGFVLCAGRIEPRKNQLELIRALAGIETRLVVLGDVVPGHEAYAAACRRAASDNVVFHPAIAHGSPLLASALAACGCLVLPSWFETPGLVAIEAAMSGTPLVLTERGATVEYFGTLAQYVAPRDRAAMRRCVLGALAQPRNPVLANLSLQRYTWDAAVQATREAYASIL